MQGRSFYAVERLWCFQPPHSPPWTSHCGLWIFWNSVQDTALTHLPSQILHLLPLSLPSDSFQVQNVLGKLGFEKGPPNSLSLVTYIALVPWMVHFVTQGGECYYDNSSWSYRAAKHLPKKSSFTHMANGLYQLFLNLNPNWVNWKGIFKGSSPCGIRATTEMSGKKREHKRYLQFYLFYLFSVYALSCVYAS